MNLTFKTSFHHCCSVFCRDRCVSNWGSTKEIQPWNIGLALCLITLLVKHPSWKKETRIETVARLSDVQVHNNKERVMGHPLSGNRHSCNAVPHIAFMSLSPVREWDLLNRSEHETKQLIWGFGNEGLYCHSWLLMRRAEHVSQLHNKLYLTVFTPSHSQRTIVQTVLRYISWLIIFWVWWPSSI